MQDGAIAQSQVLSDGINACACRVGDFDGTTYLAIVKQVGDGNRAIVRAVMPSHHAWHHARVDDVVIRCDEVNISINAWRLLESRQCMKMRMTRAQENQFFNRHSIKN
jgi:hypothetical protein